MSYFNKFPIIKYGDRTCVDITSRVAVSAKDLTSLVHYSRFVMPDGTKPHELAHDYYDASSDDWLLFLSNNIVDPYYDWPLPQGVFDEMIVRRYGSINNALERRSHFKLTLPEDQLISDATYNALPELVKQFYSRFVSGDTGEFLGWKPNKVDWQVVSPRMYSATTSLTYNVGDTIVQGQSRGEIVSVNGTSVVIGKTKDTFVDDANHTGVTLLEEASVDPTLLIYLTPVSHYENETNINDEKKAILVLDRGVATELEDIVEGLLNE